MDLQVDVFELMSSQETRQWLLVLLLLSVFALLSWRIKLGIGREAGFSALRAIAQLLLLASVILFIFEKNDALLVLMALFVMTMFGAYTASRRSGVGGAFLPSLASIGTASLAVLGITVVCGGLSTDAIMLIPLGGMVVGNCMNVSSLAMNRLNGEVMSNYSIIEASIALGCDNSKALEPYRLKGIRSSLIPVVDNLKTLGVVWIPGLMAGLLLAGASPYDAARLQLLLFSMIILASLISSILSTSWLRDAVLIEASKKIEKSDV